MAPPRDRKPARPRIDEAELAAFRAGLRRRYTDDEILDELRAAVERLRLLTMREFAADDEARVHPQTAIEHFGTWNAAKRAAGLYPRRFLTRDELLEQLRGLGRELGRTPTARDLAARGRSLPSASLYSHTFGSLGDALREAGFEVLRGEDRLERAIVQGAELARRLGHLPRMADRRPRGERIPRSSPSGRSTGCSTSRGARGRRSSTSSAKAERAIPALRDGPVRAE